MATAYTQDELRRLFQSSFNLKQWYSFLLHFFNASELKERPEPIIKDTIDEGYYLGNIDTKDHYHIGFFYYNIRKGSVANKRVGLRNLVKSFINPTWGIFDAALVVFDSGDHWRLSFISDIKGDATSPKRYTYVFGSNELLYKTPIERFRFLQDKGISFENLKTAFSVEALSDEFFYKYREQYANFIQYVTGKRFVKVGNKWEEKLFGEPDAALMQAFNYNEKKIRDYVKKMMGRITFLHFLQRKRWMCGDLNYMQNLFENSKYKNDYLDSVLEPLFFGILNTKPDNREALFIEYGWDKALLEEWKDIPYLNGGLFERDEDDEPESKFPADYFKRLFQFFSEYNFTIDENDPNDAEIGVDPEMLGHIFENLLEDNKDKGAFYTPKEIVHYMCRQSVIQYLKTHEPDEQYVEPIEQLINNGIVMPILQTKDVASRFMILLKEVKVCDPAIGSGAFPMGILHVLYYAIHNLQPHAEPNRSFNSIETKRKIIQNNIFGVDIEQGAVDIARLRFWLALVVDADEPQPLPNLDYKITCGNSQICRYSLNTPISDVFVEYNRIGKEKAKKENKVWNDFTLESYKKLVVGYTEEHNDKNSLKAKINEIKSCFKTTLAKGDIKKRLSAEKKVYDYEAIPLFGEPLAKEDPIGYSKAKSELKKLIEKEKEILNNKKYENSFEWRFEYPQLLNEEGVFMGFDIIIANPPYIKEGRMSKTFFEPYKDSPYYKGKMDIWYLFACNGLDLLNSKGVLCFIATNNWVTSYGASKLRDKVIKETRICNIVDFGAVMMFESASIQTMIMMFQKDKTSDNYSFDYRKLTAYKATEKEAINVLDKTSNDAEYYTPIIKRENFYGKNITFSKCTNIFEKITNYPNLIYLTNKEIAQGIVFPQDTLNKKNQQILGPEFYVNQGIFVLNSTELDALSLNKDEMSLIKPYYTNENIENYYVQRNNKYWTIYTDSRFRNPNSLNNFPNIKAHLDRFLPIFTSDNKPYGLHRARENRFFVNNKIIAVRKSVGHPMFSYCDFECYLSQTFNMIQTNRVNLKYLTGLLNSKLIEFWLKNRGKMQGANYQLDKEPLQQIPIAVPSDKMQEAIIRIVDYILIIKSLSSDVIIDQYVDNNLIVRQFEKVIDALVYEIYFHDDFIKADISFTDSVLRDFKSVNTNSSIKIIQDAFAKLRSMDNDIRNNLKYMSVKLEYLLAPIINI